RHSKIRQLSLKRVCILPHLGSRDLAEPNGSRIFPGILRNRNTDDTKIWARRHSRGNEFPNIILAHSDDGAHDCHLLAFKSSSRDVISCSARLTVSAIIPSNRSGEYGSWVIGIG